MTAPITSTENLGMSLSASDVGGIQYTGKGISGSPQKANNLNVGTTNSGGVGSGASNSSGPSYSSQEVEGPSQHPPTRLSSLQKCARLIKELATDKVGFLAALIFCGCKYKLIFPTFVKTSIIGTLMGFLMSDDGSKTIIIDGRKDLIM